MILNILKRQPTFNLILTHEELSMIHEELYQMELTKDSMLHKLFLKSLDALVV